MADAIRESAGGYTLLPVDDVLLSRRQLFLTGQITGESAADLVRKILFLQGEDGEKKVTLYISSPGGEVDAGLGIYDALMLSGLSVRTVCTGLAASMASLIFLAGKERLILPHAQLMIHDPSYSGGSFAGMKPDEISQYLGSLEKTREVLVHILSERCGRTPEEIRSLTAKDTYFTAEEAVSFGLATGIAKDLA
ncbi:MAG TPA: ATP-dependent Clp protease proteolytic subunit [Lachnospiraceae bacterium]|jgi:ATP-dependent Clp protease protease subunit|nr:ATP-dependent Clp protease proteolytic subunit [Lachnospiraceae bacterium]